MRKNKRQALRKFKHIANKIFSDEESDYFVPKPVPIKL